MRNMLRKLVHSEWNTARQVACMKLYRSVDGGLDGTDLAANQLMQHFTDAVKAQAALAVLRCLKC